MYYRRKIILALFEVFGETLSAIKFQKLLFLFTRKQEIKAFHFLPYNYGCFSFQANQDVHILKKYGYFNISEDGKNIQLLINENYISQLNLFDKQYLQNIKTQFGSFTQDDLIKHIYTKYPYYATKSVIVQKILNSEELQKVRQQIFQCHATTLFTIGYEGISLETYINKLIKNDVRILCDVRKNAFSQKYGFSKNQLSSACDGVKIKYLHIPNLGIVSNKRQALNTQSDYDVLFEDYKLTVLKQNIKEVHSLFKLLQREKRIALTCFEANINQCHRKHLAEAITNMPDFKYELKHI